MTQANVSRIERSENLYLRTRDEVERVLGEWRDHRLRAVLNVLTVRLLRVGGQRPSFRKVSQFSQAFAMLPAWESATHSS
jgi:hypothetical protein